MTRIQVPFNHGNFVIGDFVIPSEARNLGFCRRRQTPGFLAPLGMTTKLPTLI